MARFETDVLVLGSGSAGLVAALTAAAQGLRVTVLEKTAKLGGTTAMSGAGTWVPANHHAAAAGIADSEAEALDYIRAAAPDGWAAEEDALWQAYVRAAPAMLRFVEESTPLRFALTPEPDPLRGLPGHKARGRMLSPCRSAAGGQGASPSASGNRPSPSCSPITRRSRPTCTITRIVRRRRSGRGCCGAS